MENTTPESAEALPIQEVDAHLNPILKAMRQHEKCKDDVIQASHMILRHKLDGSTHSQVPRVHIENLRRAFKALAQSVASLKDMHSTAVKTQSSNAQSSIPRDSDVSSEPGKG